MGFDVCYFADDFISFDQFLKMTAKAATIYDDKIVLETATMHMGDDGILYVKYHEDAEIELEDAKKHIATAIQLSNGKPVPVLINAKGVNSNMSPEARKYFSESEDTRKYRKVLAVVVDSLANRLVANFFISFNKPSEPTKVFNDKGKAIEWLNQFL
ncbi:MAG: hypothetical protein COA57_04595 [Flavobacteriales bacterium]|nr:MAG: hypothetical protein COA57_04595 [Flavobacteriales bacterium]